MAKERDSQLKTWVFGIFNVPLLHLPCQKRCELLQILIKDVIFFKIRFNKNVLRKLTENNLRILLALLSVFYVAVTVV